MAGLSQSVLWFCAISLSSLNYRYAALGVRYFTSTTTSESLNATVPISTPLLLQIRSDSEPSVVTSDNNPGSMSKGPRLFQECTGLKKVHDFTSNRNMLRRVSNMAWPNFIHSN